MKKVCKNTCNICLKTENMLLNYYTKRDLSYLTPHSQKKKKKKKPKQNKSYLTPKRVTLFDIFNLNIYGSNLIFPTIKLLKKFQIILYHPKLYLKLHFAS